MSQHRHELVESLVASGRYRSASEVLRGEGLRLLERQEAEDASRLAALRHAAETGWTDLASGRYDDVTGDQLDVYVGRLGAHAAPQSQSTG